ncbi:MAG: TlpA disulfide reductase family protein [Planctomycetaceae bacterium]
MRICLLFLIALGLPASSVHATDDTDGTLFWGNGDSLTGQLVSAKDQTLVWKSPLFAEPLAIDLAVLSAVSFPELEASQPADINEGFLITLVNNNVLSGTLTAVNDQTMTFDSQRHGRLVLNRSAIRNLQRSRNQGLLFLGPRGLEGWTTRPVTSTESIEQLIQLRNGAAREDVVSTNSDWREEDDGSLTTVKGHASLKHDFDFPERCEIEITVTSTTRIPDFNISFGGGSSQMPRLEMWGDSFVTLCNSRNWVDLLTVNESTRSMHFQIFIDFAKSYLAVYSETGKKLGVLQGDGWNSVRPAMPSRTQTLKFPPPGNRLAPDPQPENKGQSLTIQAVDSDLTLKRLRICEWDGAIPQELVPGESRVQLQSGSIRYGTIVGFSDDDQSLQLKVNPEVDAAAKPPATDEVADKTPEVVSVPLTEISQVVLSTEETKIGDAGRTIVAWRNGGFVSGSLVTMDHDSITLKTAFSDAPVKSSLAGVRRIGLPNSDDPKEEPDRLFFDGGSLRGNLTVEDNDEPIRWTPVGGRNATTLISGGSARFQRGAEPEEIAIDSVQFPDVVYLHDGDVFPCRLETADDEQLRIDTPVSETRQLNASLVKAVEFGNSHRARRKGFSDQGWTRGAGNVNTHDGKAISFTGNATYGHESILTGDAVSFTLKWKPTCYGSLTMMLFADSLKHPESATVVNLTLQPNQLIVSDKAPDQNGRAFFGFNQGGDQDGMVRINNQTAKIELIARDGKLHVSVNEQEVKAIELNPLGAVSQRLLFSTTLTSVNSRNTRTLKTTVRGMVDIEDFLVRNIVGASVKQFVREEARERTLLVPRFRRDDPPTHVLLAPNGDLLRGRLTAITDGDIVFESRLESFRFPRDRVAAVIWLSTVDEETQKAARPATAVQARLDNGYMLTMTPEKMSDGQLVGTSRQLGTCRIPAKAIRDLFLGRHEDDDGVMSYVRWIRREAVEPRWETPQDGGDGTEHETVGRIAEDFELITLDGGLFKLSDHADKIVVLDFWATWCGPCVAALPEYVNGLADLDPSQAIFVAVNLEETPDRINEFLQRHDLSPTVALDRGSVIAKRFGVSGIPHSVILGPGNVIKHVTVGYQKGIGDKTRQRIQQLLDEGLQ